MAMNGNGMGDEVAAAIEALGVMHPPETAADIQPLWEAICTAIVAHITNNAEIATDVMGDGLATLPVQVVPASGTGSTTAPDVIIGTGEGTIS